MKRMIKILVGIVAVTALSFSQETRNKRIVFAGDSITDGAWGRSDGTKRPMAKRDHGDLNHVYGHSYMMLSAARVQADMPETMTEFYNRGISGNTLEDLENRWEEDVLSLNPDVISVLIGTNDVHFYLEGDREEAFDYDGWERRYRSLLDRARARNPKMRFMLGTPFTAKAGKIGASDDYEERAHMTEELARRTVRIAEDYDSPALRYDELWTRAAEEHEDVAISYWIWDGIHPTPAGHQLMADLWVGTLLDMDL